MPSTSKTVSRCTATKVPGLQSSEFIVRQLQRSSKPNESANTDPDYLFRPLGRVAPQPKPLYKSSSLHDIKSSRSNSNSSVGSRDSSKESHPKNVNAVRKLASAVALPTAVLRESNSSASYIPASSSVSGDRIYVNSDLLSRVEKEKKQYEARISELTQLTESRKTEIERLSIEVKNLREAKERAEFLVQRHSLKRRAGDDISTDADSCCPSCQRPLLEESSPTTVVPATSTTPDQQSIASIVSGTDSKVEGSFNSKKPTVTSLEDIIHEMEEVNYSTTEELEATMNELREMQRTLDGTQEENRTLASDRAILLESLCTQTAKLEHSRLQIDQLKHLLITNPMADSRESHYMELFNSIDAEKQILLAQNNDLAQRCESLDVECRQLTEKMESMSSDMEQLKADAAAVLYPNVMYSKEELSGEDLNAKIECLTRHVALWQERYESELVEHEREVTEFKLYEKDLLKAVQVADTIRHESEVQAARFKIKICNLRKQMEMVSSELETALNEKSQLEEQLSKVKDTNTSASASCLPPNQNPSAMEVGKRSIGVMTLPVEMNSGEASFISSPNSSTQPVLAPSQIPKIASTPSAPASTFHLPRTSYMQTLGLSPSVSPGGPVSTNSSLGIRRAGPTVQSLIQSIENQVKTVQHQQKMKTSSASSILKSTKNADDECTSPLLPQRRLHSAGSSPITTPIRNSPKPLHHLLIDESIVGQSAPGGPPHNPTSPSSGAVPSSNQPATPSTSLMRSAPSFVVNRDDTSSAQDSPARIVSSSKTPRLKRNITVPSSSSISNTTDNVGSTNSTIAEAVTTVISAAVGDPGAPPQSPSGDSNLPTASDSTACSSPAVPVDPLQELAKRTGAASKRNALLKWCQLRLMNYRAVDVTNFSSSWNDGLALCALLHTYVPHLITMSWSKVVDGMDKKKRFELAFKVAESQGIATTLDLNEMLNYDRPDWASVMAYIASIYRHFEVPKTSS